MSAFAAAVDLLFADPNIGRDAVHTPDGGTPVPVRIIARRADEVTGFGDGDRVAEALTHHAAQETARDGVVFEDKDFD